VISSDRPFFSVIIPTRNRPSQLAVALHSVREQHYRDFEVIVVDDGSSAEHQSGYRELVEVTPSVTRILTLVRIENGHGPGYGRNYGAHRARGDYLCFLDDDDQWTDADHLSRVAGVITKSPEPIHLILANQVAFRDGAPVPGIRWIDDLMERLGGAPGVTGSYVVTPSQLLGCQAHCHLNTMIVSRTFFVDVGGFDDGLRYEEDRDFYLRAIDRATVIKFLPVTVSRHNIPDPKAKASASTLESELSKRLYQLRVFDKAVLFSARPELRRHAMHQRAFILKHIATEAARLGWLDCAAYYAREALITSFTWGWLGATTAFALRRLLATTLGFLNAKQECGSSHALTKPIRR